MKKNKRKPRLSQILFGHIIFAGLLSCPPTHPGNSTPAAGQIVEETPSTPAPVNTSQPVVPTGDPVMPQSISTAVEEGRKESFLQIPFMISGKVIEEGVIPLIENPVYSERVAETFTLEGLIPTTIYEIQQQCADVKISYPCPTLSNPDKKCSKTISACIDIEVPVTIDRLIEQTVSGDFRERVDIRNLTISILENGVSGCGLTTGFDAGIELDVDLGNIPAEWSINESLSTDALVHVTTVGLVKVNRNGEFVYEHESASADVVKPFYSNFFSAFGITDCSMADYLSLLTGTPFLNDWLNTTIQAQFDAIAPELKPRILQRAAELIETTLPFKLPFENESAWFTLEADEVYELYITQLEARDGQIYGTSGISGRPVIVFGAEPGSVQEAGKELTLYNSVDNKFNLLIPGRVELPYIRVKFNEALQKEGYNIDLPENILLDYLEVLNDEELNALIKEYVEWGEYGQLTDLLAGYKGKVFSCSLENSTGVNIKIESIRYVSGFVLKDNALYFIIEAEGQLFGDEGEGTPVNFTSKKTF